MTDQQNFSPEEIRLSKVFNTAYQAGIDEKEREIAELKKQLEAMKEEKDRAYNEGKDHGGAIAAAEAYSKGYDEGHKDAWESCMDGECLEAMKYEKEKAYDKGHSDGYDEGKSDGYEDGTDVSWEEKDNKIDELETDLELCWTTIRELEPVADRCALELMDVEQERDSARESLEYFVRCLCEEDNSMDAFSPRARFGCVQLHTSNVPIEILLDLPKPKQEEPVYYFVRVYEHENEKYPYYIGGYDGMLWAFEYDGDPCCPEPGDELCVIDPNEYESNGCMTDELREILLSKDKC
jgi:flagellar biosynthesis/type III secretory pathway protein FliH